MQCKYPITAQNGATVRCGRCANCRVTKRSQITARGIMESLCYPPDESHFITHTMNDDFLTKAVIEDPFTGLVQEEPALIQQDATLLLNRYRDYAKRKYDKQIRYLCAGELGEKGVRVRHPHYHLIVHGLNQAEAIDVATLAWSVTRNRKGLTCDHVPTVKVKTPNTPPWQFHHERFPSAEKRQLRGFVTFGDGTPASIQYTASYCLSGMTDYKELPAGLVASFATWSKRPAYGAVFMHNFAKNFLVHHKVPGLKATYGPGKVWAPLPTSIQLPTANGLSPFSLDRAMRKALLEGMGLSPVDPDVIDYLTNARETREAALLLPGDPLGLRREAERMQEQSDGKAARAFRRHRLMRQQSAPG